MEKLAALVPPPRFHLVRYHGILAPCASTRDRVVPGAPTREHREGSPALANSAACLAGEPEPDENGTPEAVPDSRPHPAHEAGTVTSEQVRGEASPSPARPTTRPRRLAWAELLRRVFAVEVRECPRCGGRMRVLAAIHPPDATDAILACLALPARAPPTGEARVDDSSEEAPAPAFDVDAEPAA